MITEKMFWGVIVVSYLYVGAIWAGHYITTPRPTRPSKEG